jgi:hypothetical protein
LANKPSAASRFEALCMEIQQAPRYLQNNRECVDDVPLLASLKMWQRKAPLIAFN